MNATNRMDMIAAQARVMEARANGETLKRYTFRGDTRYSHYAGTTVSAYTEEEARQAVIDSGRHCGELLGTEPHYRFVF